MTENLCDQRWVLDTSDDSQSSTAPGTGLDVDGDGERELEAFSPAHQCRARWLLWVVNRTNDTANPFR